ncbi:glycosyltransferase family 4 protein [Cytobacillus suaedae]|nr:glycosyltransferase family 4 protein [Cytobacillus suaedae]
MKVVLVTPNFHQPRGNTVTVRRIANELENLKVQTEIISMTEDNVAATPLPEADVYHGFHAYQFFRFMERLEKKPKSYVITLTGTDLNHNLFDEKTRPIVVSCLQNAKAIHVFNEEAKHILINELPDLSRKTHIVPQGVDRFPQYELDYHKEYQSFLFVLPAGIRKVKNVPFAIESLARLKEKHQNVCLWLVGPVLEEDEGKIVEEFVHTNSSWITYLGQVPHKQMGAIYQQADCILNTSISEGQPSSILEAMAHELPVIVSDNQGNRSIVTHQETGLVYNTSDEFLDYTEQIMNNNELRQMLGKKAKDFVDQHHNSQKEAKHLFDIYQDIQSN